MANRPRIKRATSSDVARLAGVSHTTVSFVVNNVATAHIPDETRARVRAAIAQLDYQPHEGARSLSRKATRDIGVVIPDATNLFYIEIVGAIEAFARSKGYRTVVSATGFDAQIEWESLTWLKQQRIDALILCAPTGTHWYDEARRLLGQGYTITAIGFNLESDEPSIRGEVGRGERLVLEHLAALGHRRIGYIYGVFNQELYGARLDACLAIQRELGLPVQDEWVCCCGPTPDDGYRATSALLSSCPASTRPTALVVVNDHLALGVLSALYRAGVAVPTALSVASFDNTPLARYAIPALTTVDLDARTLGAEAARVTIERLTEPEAASSQVHVQPRLIVRDSTGPAPG